MWEWLTGKFGKAGAIFGAVVGAVAVAKIVWASADYVEIRPIIKKEFTFELSAKKSDIDKLYKIAGDISKSVLTLQFYDMQDKIKAGQTMTFEEQQRYCDLAEQLQWIVPGCTMGVAIPSAPIPDPG